MLISYRTAEESDLAFLLELRLQTMHEHAVGVGRTPSRDDHMQRVLKRFDCAKIIIVNGMDGGLLKVDRDQDPWHLMQIQLAPRFQGFGLGTRILGELVEDARAAGMDIRLGVFKSNPAQRLYQRLGFVPVQETSDSVRMYFASTQGLTEDAAQLARTTDAASRRR